MNKFKQLAELLSSNINLEEKFGISKVTITFESGKSPSFLLHYVSGEDKEYQIDSLFELLKDEVSKNSLSEKIGQFSLSQIKKMQNQLTIWEKKVEDHLNLQTDADNQETSPTQQPTTDKVAEPEAPVAA